MGPALFWFAVGMVTLIAAIWALPPVQAKIPTQEGEEPYHGKWGSAIRRAIGAFICLSIAYSTIPLSDEEQARVDAECKAELDCWVKRYQIAAEFECAPALEARAKYAFEWTDTMSNRKLPKQRAIWLDQEKGHVAFFGSELKFQNGFGAFQQVAYRCDFDTINDRVLDTRIVTADTTENILSLYSQKE